MKKRPKRRPAPRERLEDIDLSEDLVFMEWAAMSVKFAQDHGPRDGVFAARGKIRKRMNRLRDR